MSSRIAKYQTSILKFVKTKSIFSKIIKEQPIIELIAADIDYMSPIILLTITTSNQKKKSIKTYHGYYMASGVFMAMLIVQILDNKKFYDTKYGKNVIDQIIGEVPFYIYNCLSQNLETLANSLDEETVLSIYHKATEILTKKLLLVMQPITLTAINLVRRTDVIKYKFKNKNIINDKYKKLKRVDKDKLIDYVDQKYGSVCQMAFTLGWLMSSGDEKLANNFERLGTHLGLLVKLVKDFQNIEQDIDNSNVYSTNLLVNTGIHECFALFSETKLKLIEGCMTLDVFTITVKEIVDYLERKFEECLGNTDLELKSMYSSFSPSRGSSKSHSDSD